MVIQQKESNIKLSIIIPTRNGGKYIGQAIKTITSQDYENLEIIISINHSTDETQFVVENIKDKRVKIIYPPTLLSMTKHYEYCLENTRGDWVTIIGDDDGVIYNFFENFEYILSREKDIDVIMTNKCYYFWEGAEDKNKVLVYRNNNIKKVIKPKIELALAIMGIKSHMELPELYTGNIIKKDLINRIKKSSKNYFYHELNPDVYSGVAISLMAKKIIYTGRGMFWIGTSTKSVGLQVSKSKLNQKNVDEFYSQSDIDNLRVANEVGIQNWKELKSSSIWIISALFKVPFINKKINPYKKFLLTTSLSGLIVEKLINRKCLIDKYSLNILNTNEISKFLVTMISFVCLLIAIISKIKKTIINFILKKQVIIYTRNNLKNLTNANEWVKKQNNEY